MCCIIFVGFPLLFAGSKKFQWHTLYLFSIRIPVPITINIVDFVKKRLILKRRWFQHTPSTNCQCAGLGFIPIHPFYLQCYLFFVWQCSFLATENSHATEWFSITLCFFVFISFILRCWTLQKQYEGVKNHFGDLLVSISSCVELSISPRVVIIRQIVGKNNLKQIRYFYEPPINR